MPGLGSHYVSANGIRIHFLTGGHGHSIVLLHGLTDWARVWEPAAERLFGRLIVPDLRGHGLSEKPASGYALSNLATDVAMLIEQLGDVPATLIGHSVGAVIALYTATTYVSSIQGIVLVDPPLRWQRAQAEGFLTQMAELRGLDYPKLLAAYASRHPGWSEMDLYLRVQGLIRFSLRCGRGLLIENRDHSLEPLLTTVRCPALIIAGEQRLGGSLNAEEVKQAGGLLPRGEAIMIPGAGHSVYRDQPDGFWRSVQDFLAAVNRKGDQVIVETTQDA